MYSYDSEAIVDFETKMAEVTWTRVERRDRQLQRLADVRTPRPQEDVQFVENDPGPIGVEPELGLDVGRHLQAHLLPEPLPEVRWTGFPAPSAFLVGYGLDHAEDHRHLPFIGDLI